MKRLTLALLLSAATTPSAWAQTRQPGQMTTLPAAIPQEFDLLDKTGAWVPFGTLDSVAHVFKPILWLDPKDPPWNAKCDGAGDDTLPLQMWAAAVTSGAHLILTGSCAFTGQIAFAQAAVNVTLEGGTLLYTGASTTLDPIIQVGQRNAATGCDATSWMISDLTFLSSTKMTAGDGLRISDGCSVEIAGLTVGGDAGSPNLNLFNSIRLDGGNNVHVRGYKISGSNIALSINGDTGVSRQFTDPFFFQGVIANSRIGVNICGSVGGFRIDQSDILLNGTNVLIDRSCVSRANLQLTFGPEVSLDATDPVTYPSEPQIGLHMSDPGGPNTLVTYQGWLATATNQCFVYDNGTPDNPAFPPVVNFSGARIGNCHMPAGGNAGAIENNNTSAQINVTASRFFSSQGGGKPTVYNVSGAPGMKMQANTQDANFNISGVWYGYALNNSGLATVSSSATAIIGNASVTGTLTASGAVSGVSLQATGPSSGLQMRSTGGTQPADQKNWDFSQVTTTGDLNFRSVNDAYSSSSNYITFTRGSAATLTGALITLAPPVTFSQYMTLANLTYAALPACGAGQSGRLAMINDAPAPVYGANVTVGGGSTRTLLLCNGTNWTAH